MLPGPFSWADEPIYILRACFRPGLQLKKNLSVVQSKVGAAVQTWLRWQLSIKSRAVPLMSFLLSLLSRLAILRHMLTDDFILEGSFMDTFSSLAITSHISEADCCCKP